MKLIRELNEDTKDDIDDYVETLVDQFVDGKKSYSEVLQTLQKLHKSYPGHDFDFWVIMLDTEADRSQDHPGVAGKGTLGTITNHRKDK